MIVVGNRFIECAVLAALVAVGGCASQDAVYQDVRRSRTDDYERWQAARRQGAAAEPSVAGQLTLEDAVKIALLYNKELQAVDQETAIAHGRTLEARARALPSVTAHSGYTRLDEAPRIGFGDQSFEAAVVDNYSASLVVKQPLYEGGAISAALRAARLNAVLSDEKIREQVERTVFATASAFYDALFAQRLFDVNRDAVKSAEAHLDDVNKRRKQGTASDYDRLRGEVEVSNFKAEMLRQRNRITRAQTVLLKSMGVSQEQDKDLSLVDALVYQAVSMTWDDAAQAALENRPELYEAELAVRLQQEALRTAQSAYLPSLNAVVTETEANPAPHTPSVKSAFAASQAIARRSAVLGFDNGFVFAGLILLGGAFVCRASRRTCSWRSEKQLTGAVRAPRPAPHP